MLRTNRTNCAKSCLDMFDGAIVSEICYHEQVLIIEDLRSSARTHTKSKETG